MEQIGKQMIEHTGGLPLAIKVLGGFLAAKYTLKDWKRISENVGSHIMEGTLSNEDNNSSVYGVLSMSFDELPSHLKSCFLYLAHFPEDYLISVENLSYYWAAEGIPKPRHYDGETIRDIGDSYIEELVRRNMVISEKDVKTLRFETCHLHDMMREVCLFKAKEENFLQITSSRPSTANFQSCVISRRLVSHNPTTLHVERDINNPKLRSLVVVQVLWGEGWELLGSRYTRLELIRVLDLYRAKLKKEKLPSGIGKLIHLKYLSLNFAEVTHLPSSLGNLMLLIYLNITVFPKAVFVPNVLMGMQELRYLSLPNYMHKDTKFELSKLVNLETLKNFSTERSSVKDLCGMAKLRTLTIDSIAGTSLKTLSTSIGGLKHLENLSIFCATKRTKEEEIVLDFLHLKILNLDIYMPRLPKEGRFPLHLTILVLRRCEFEEDPMPFLEKLLQLKEVSLRVRSFCGRRMVCSGDDGFPQLQKLLISGLQLLEDCIVKKGSMPRLHTLKIFNCPSLLRLFDGMEFIYSLKELSVNENWKGRSSEGGEDYDKVKHIPSLKYEKYYD